MVDTAVPALTQGGAAVLVDDDLNTTSLQFYRQTLDGGTAPVQLLAPSGDAGAGNPLHTSLASSIDPATEPWKTISSAAAELIAQRHRLQAAVMNAKLPTGTT